MEPQLVPLSLYIHLPWCVKKCPYCDFNSHTHRGDIPKEDYIEALIADLQTEALSLDNPRPLVSVFFGGGTPSLFSGTQIGRLLREVRDLFSVSDSMEVTLEANPGTVEHDAFEKYLEVGVNRISLGIQSFQNDALQALGRIHDSESAHHAIASLINAGFDNYNLDLMFALPEQLPSQAQADIQALLEHQPPHLSYYQLTLEPRTAFYAKPPPLPNDDSAWQMQQRSLKSFVEAGYQQYEVSAYAKPNKFCRHNLNYWQYGDYIGVGAGAHGKITKADGSVWRTEKTTQPNRYTASHSKWASDPKRVSVEEQTFEFMLNELRQTEGVSKQRFGERTQATLAQLDAGVTASLDRGLLEETPFGWRPTPRGQQFLNDLQAQFLPPEKP